MASTGASSSWTAALSTRVLTGILGGLVGGLGFGVLMQLMDMIPMVAMLVGSESVAVGWIVHLGISALFGLTYAVLFFRWADRIALGVPLGIAYGVVWWVLGALLIMPAQLGMPTFVLNTTAWQSLLGHAVYGLLLGLTYAAVRGRARRG